MQSNHEYGRYIEDLRKQIYSFELLLLDMKQRLAKAEQAMSSLEPKSGIKSHMDGSSLAGTNLPIAPFTLTTANPDAWRWPLEAEEYTRYGRQMIMPEVGLQGRRHS